VTKHPENVTVKYCESCGGKVHARRSTRRWCSDTCRKRGQRARAKPSHQYVIRQEWQERDPRPVMDSLTGCTVRAIPIKDARPIIQRYEWLGTIGRAVAAYGLHTTDGELIGVALFGRPGSPEAGDLCGPDYRDRAICLERGACVHWAHPHAASFLISRACKLAAADHGWRIFYAYADPSAGELGTVYQACNWLYLGQNVGRRAGSGMRNIVIDPNGREYSTRGLRHRGWKIEDIKHWPGWRIEKRPAKRKYCQLIGSRSELKKLRAALRYPPLPYPKR